MNPTPTQYTIEVQRIRLYGTNPAPKLTTGTLEELTEYFSYTLECGSSHNKRVSRHPKTIDSLVANLNRAALASSAHYQSTYYNLVD